MLTLEPALQALSYYKIFGYPTGLGALLVHKRAVPLLMKRKRYFGGGTVAVSVAEEDFFRLAQSACRLSVVVPASWKCPLALSMGVVAYAHVMHIMSVHVCITRGWPASCQS